MYRLLIDTSFPTPMIAWGPAQHAGPETIKSDGLHVGSQIISEWLEALDLSLNPLKEVIVSIGPGSFTGIRVGIAYAQGLAAGLRCEIRTCSSFALLAEHLYPEVKQTLFLPATKMRGAAWSPEMACFDASWSGAFVDIRNHETAVKRAALMWKYQGTCGLRPMYLRQSTAEENLNG